MLRRVLKHTALAAALLIPTLAGVALQAPAAFASGVPATIVGPYKNAASIQLVAEQANGSGTWTGNYITMSMGLSLSPGMGGGHFSDNLTGAQNQPFAATPTLYMSWSFQNAGGLGCVAVGGNPYEANVDLYFNNSVASVQGGFAVPWQPAITGCSGEASVPITLDDSPFDGFNDQTYALTPNTYQLYLEAEGGAMFGLGSYDGTTTQDAPGPGTSAQVAEGTFQINHPILLGLTGGSETETAAIETTNCGTGKDCFGITRQFKSSWANPGGSGTDYWKSTGQGKAVALSVVPPAWSGTCGVYNFTTKTCPNGGISPWKQATNYATAAPTGVATMRTIIQGLENGANQSTGPSFVTISITHEPHDNATDTSQGLAGGKCGQSGDPSIDPSGSKGPCFGTAAEYTAMYTALRQTRDNSCDINGGTTGTGNPCSKVLIQYIGVPSNMTPEGSLAGSHVGDGDPMRPLSADYDILGGDPYNYGCYDNGTPTSPTCTGDGGWESFQQSVDDPTVGLDRAGTDHLTLLGLADHLGKKVILDEVASHPGCTGSSDSTNMCNHSVPPNPPYVGNVTSRETWMSDAYTYQSTNATFQKFVIGWIYFHETTPTAAHDWRFLYDGTNATDTRGRTPYTTHFLTDPNFKNTAAYYPINLTP